MGNSALFMPPLYISFSVPTYEKDHDFWNPKQTPEGINSRNSFISALSEEFKFLPNEKGEEIVNQISEYGFDFFSDTSEYLGINYEGSLNDVNDIKTLLIDYLPLISNSKSTLEEALSTLKNLEYGSWEDMGAYDSLGLLILLKASSEMSFRVPDEIKNQIKEYIEGLTSEELRELCGILGVEIVEEDGSLDVEATKEALNKKIDETINQFSSFSTIDESSLNNLSVYLVKKSMLPPMGRLTASTFSRATTSAQEQQYKHEKERIRKKEREEKKIEKEQIAERKVEKKRILAEKMQGKNVKGGKRI